MRQLELSIWVVHHCFVNPFYEVKEVPTDALLNPDGWMDAERDKGIVCAKQKKGKNLQNQKNGRLMCCPKERLRFLAGRRPTRYGIRRLVPVPATMVLEWTSSLQQALTRLTRTALQLAMAPITTALQLCQLMQTALQQMLKLLLAALQHRLGSMQRHSKDIRSVWTVSCSLYSAFLLHTGTYTDIWPWLFACNTAVQAVLATMPANCS